MAIFLHGKDNSSKDPSNFRLRKDGSIDGDGSMLTRLSHSSIGDGIPFTGCLRGSREPIDPRQVANRGLRGDGSGVGTPARRSLSVEEMEMSRLLASK